MRFFKYDNKKTGGFTIIKARSKAEAIKFAGTKQVTEIKPHGNKR